MPEIIDTVFTKTSPNRSFSMTEYERFGLVFTKRGSINSGTGLSPMRMVADKDAHRHLSAISLASHGVYGPGKLNCRTSPSQHFNICAVARCCLNRAILGTGRLCARRLARSANHTAAAYSWLFWGASTHYRSN